VSIEIHDINYFAVKEEFLQVKITNPGKPPALPGSAGG